MSHWWRAHDEAVDDPKLQLLPPAVFKGWFNLMCLASANSGRLPSLATIAFKLHLTQAKAKHLVAELTARGLLDEQDGGFVPHNWSARQFKSDVTDPTNAERQKRYRKRHPVTEKVTAKPVTVTPPILQRTDTDSEASASAVEVVGEDPKAALFRIGKTILVSFGVSEKRTGALIGQWLKAKNDPAGLLAAIQFARNHNVAEPVAYISTLLKKQDNSNGQYGKRNLTDLAFELAGEARELEREAGLHGPDDVVGGH